MSPPSADPAKAKPILASVLVSILYFLAVAAPGASASDVPKVIVAENFGHIY